jgi:predicted nucleotide-binding protein (sugar kinase/HSP70/actin superfamily)
MSERSERKKFWKKIKDENYLILIPDMLPYHFTLIAEVFTKHGYRTQMVTATGRQVKDEGLKSVHNDACYPALIVTGQFMCELKSGKYDLNKTAVMMSQTGGGCRASNYISLIRKAMAKEFPTVPVCSLNVSGLEKTYSMPISVSMLVEMAYSSLYGDLLMLLYEQTVPYETEKGQARKIMDECLNYCKDKLHHGHAFYQWKKNYAYIISRFSEIKIPAKRKPKVGIVGEIYVKYSAMANNGLVDFLVSEGCEPFSPSLIEFILYCFTNVENDYRYYGRNKLTRIPAKIVYNYLYKKTRQLDEALKGTQFTPYEDFAKIRSNTSKIISQGVKMGEGWLIPSEMITMAQEGVKDIVCCQPFGCLPNHIVGKGMIRPIKALCPDLNIAAIDYDPGATKVNQENRIKLMLSNIQEREGK